MSDTSTLVAVISIIVSGFLGTGGAGYAVVQWWIKRNDLESRANAARILTDAASGIILELREEKKELNRIVADQTEKLDRVYSEFRALKKPVLILIQQLSVILPDLSHKDVELIKPTLTDIQAKL